MSRFLGCVFGLQQSGKTYLARNYFIPRVKRPTFIVDPKGEFSQGKIFQNKEGLLYLMSQDPPGNGVYIFRPPSSRRKVFRDFFQMINSVGEPCTIIADEAQIYSKNTKVVQPLSDIYMIGSQWDISVLVIARRPKEITTDLRSQSQFVISFKQTMPEDVKYLKGYDSQAGNVKNLHYRPGDPENEFFILGYYIPKWMSDLKLHKKYVDIPT